MAEYRKLWSFYCVGNYVLSGQKRQDVDINTHIGALEFLSFKAIAMAGNRNLTVTPMRSQLVPLALFCKRLIT